MNEEMGGGSEVVVLDSKSSKSELEQFWQELGGKGFISPPDQEDSEAAENMTLSTKLFRFQEEEPGRLEISNIEGNSHCILSNLTLDTFRWSLVRSCTKAC